MLPHPDLKPLYDRLVWVWVYRDFKKGPEDLSASRVMERFGVTMWPTMLLADPATGRPLGEAGWDPASFLKASERACGILKDPAGDLDKLQKRMDRARQAKDRDLLKKLAADPDPWEFHLEAREILESLDGSSAGPGLGDPDPDRRAEALDRLLEAKAPFPPEAEPLLKDPDAAVRLRAARLLIQAAPERLPGHAAALLDDPMDGVKWAGIEGLKASKDPGAGALLCRAWKRHQEGRIESKNPNVFRGNLAQALAEVGDASAVPLLEGQATDHDALNGTTFTCIKALGRIGKRSGPAAVTPALLRAFPPPVEDVKSERQDMPKRITYLAKLTHEALAEATGLNGIDFPAAWDATGRAGLLEAWRKALQAGAPGE